MGAMGVDQVTSAFIHSHVLTTAVYLVHSSTTKHRRLLSLVVAALHIHSNDAKCMSLGSGVLRTPNRKATLTKTRKLGNEP